jgi:hypothetical protein
MAGMTSRCGRAGKVGRWTSWLGVCLLVAVGGCTATLGLDDLDRAPQAAADVSSSVGGHPGGGGGGKAAGGAGLGGVAGAGGVGGVGGAAGVAGTAGVGASAGAAGAGGVVGDAGSGGGAGVSQAGTAGAAGTNVGGADAGTAGTGGAGAGGAPLLPVCPTDAPVVHTLETATGSYLDVSTDGAVLTMLTSEHVHTVFTRSVDLGATEVTSFTSPYGVPLRGVRQVDKNVYVFVSDQDSGSDVIFVGKGTPPNASVCDGQPEAWSVLLPKCSEKDRFFGAAGGFVAMTGCGRQAMGTYSTGSGSCGRGSTVNAPLTDGSQTTYGAALSEKLYVVEATTSPTVFAVRQKTPGTKTGTASFATTIDLGTVEDGVPRGAVFESPYLYTSVKSSATGRWDVRRFTVGQPNSMLKLHTEIEDLSGFAVREGRVVWAQLGGATANDASQKLATASVWRGRFNGESAGPSTLLTCAPAPPTTLLLTSGAVFFVDAYGPTVDGVPQNPSVRGVAPSGL